MAVQEALKVQKWKIERAAALKNNAYFHQRYLDPKHDVCWHQAEMFDFAKQVEQSVTKKGIVLEPRDHLKSTTLTFSYPIQIICRDKNHNVRILIAQKTQKDANKTIQQVIKALKTKRIQDDFDIHFEREISSFFTLHRQNQLLKDPTMEGVGVLGSITGAHFDYIICDDIVDIKNARTPGEREAVYEWFFTTLSFVIEPDTVLIYIGTRKHFDDLAAHLLKNPQYRKLVRTAFIVEPDDVEYHKDEEGNVIDVTWSGDPVVLFPEKWSVKSLLLKKAEVGSSYFNREMQNKPQAQEDAPFKNQWLKFYRFKHEDPALIDPAGKLAVFPTVFKQRIAFIDPAISVTSKSDYFALISIIIDHENRIFVEPYKGNYGRYEFPEQSKIIQNFIVTKRPWKIGIEVNAYQRALHQHLVRETIRPIVPVQHTRNKEERIIATLSPMFEAGKIYIHHELMPELLEQYETFGKSAHDDLMDALEGAIALALASTITDPNKPVGRFLG